MIFNLSDGGARKLSLAYTGQMTQSTVTVDGAPCTLYALTTSGTLTVKGKGTADLWLCGGGAGGAYTTAWKRGFDGGAGAYCASLTAQKLHGAYTVVIGSGGASGSAGGASSITQGSAALLTANGASGKNGGTGGGAAYASNNTARGYHTDGGAGGTNGGSGSANKVSTDTSSQPGGAGGAKGGGSGGRVVWHSTAASGGSATFYGSGGGGGGVRIPDGTTYRGASGAGYQGVVYIRVME